VNRDRPGAVPLRPGPFESARGKIPQRGTEASKESISPTVRSDCRMLLLGALANKRMIAAATAIHTHLARHVATVWADGFIASLSSRCGVQVAFASLVFSTWLYHFCQVGASVMIAATSLVALRTSVLPRWAALAGFVVAVLTLLHLLLPLPAALAGLLWVALVSALFLVGSGTAHPPRRLAR
jgi:hypothetical protein